MSLSDEGLQLARALANKAEELGIDLGNTNPKQMLPLYDLIPPDLKDKVLGHTPEGSDPDDILAVFVQLLISQLPERQPESLKMPNWAIKPRPN